MARAPRNQSELPKTLPVLPLSGALLLPGTRRPLNVFEPRYLALVDSVLGGDRLIGLIQPRDMLEESPAGIVPLSGTGCIGRLTHFEEQDEDRYVIVLEGVSRFNYVRDLEVDTPFRQVEIDTASFADDFDESAGEEEIDRDRLLKAIRDYADHTRIELNWPEIEATGSADLVNLCCMVAPYGPAEKQLLLEALTPGLRAEALIALTEFEVAQGPDGGTLQ